MAAATARAVAATLLLLWLLLPLLLLWLLLLWLLLLLLWLLLLMLLRRRTGPPAWRCLAKRRQNALRGFPKPGPALIRKLPFGGLAVSLLRDSLCRTVLQQRHKTALLKPTLLIDILGSHAEGQKVLPSGRAATHANCNRCLPVLWILVVGGHETVQQVIQLLLNQKQQMIEARVRSERGDCCIL